jgi:hypothetical protein
MFARVKQSRNGEYLQIVENYRDKAEPGKVKQRLVMYVGHYDSIDDALRQMKRELTQARREATTTENRYADLHHWGVGDIEDLAELAQGRRAKAEKLAEKLSFLRRIVEEHPGLLERDRVRAIRSTERRRQRGKRLTAVGHHAEEPAYIKRVRELERAYHSEDDDEMIDAIVGIRGVYDALSAEEQAHVDSMPFGVVMNMHHNRKSDDSFRGLAGFYQH